MNFESMVINIVLINMLDFLWVHMNLVLLNLAFKENNHRGNLGGSVG